MNVRLTKKDAPTRTELYSALRVTFSDGNIWIELPTTRVVVEPLPLLDLIEIDSQAGPLE